MPDSHVDKRSISSAVAHAPASASNEPPPQPRTAPIVHVEESHALPLVSIAVVLTLGAAADPPGKEGLTRVVARMLRRGTRRRSAREIEERIDSLGAELAADISPSMVTLHADVISRSLEPFGALLAELIAEPAFDEAELGRLLREIEGEIVDARDNDRALATRQFRRVLFEGHPYGRRLGGTIETIRSICKADVEAHYRRALVQGNLAFAFSGDVTRAEADALAARITQAVPAGPSSPDPTTAPRGIAGRRLVFVDKPERTQAQILIGTLGSHPRDDDHIALHVATTIFGGTFTSRLMKEIRSKRGWSYGAYARLPYDRQRDAFTVWTFPAAKDAAACIKLEIELLEAFRERGVTRSELAFAKRYLARSHAFDIDTAQKRVHQRLDIELFDLPSDYFTGYIRHVESVTEDAANQAILRRIPKDDLVISVVGTHRDTGEAVAGAIPSLAQVQVVPHDAD